MKKEIQLLEKLWKSGRIYLIENNDQGCFQLAYREGEEADPENDEMWELDVETLD